MILGLEMIFFFFFLGIAPKACSLNKKNCKFEFIKILKFCSVKDPGKKMRR